MVGESWLVGKVRDHAASGTLVGPLSRPSSQVHSAHAGFPARVHYPWHPAFGIDVKVLYREVRLTDVVFVCRAADDTAAVIPAWMFEPSWADIVLGAPWPSVRSLEQLRAILDELGFDRAGATERERSQEEGRHEADGAVIRRWPTTSTRPGTP